MTASKLGLAAADVRRARSLARQVGRPIVKLAKQHTTVSVERATLRMAGLAGADSEGTPWVNRLLDAVRADVGLEHGAALPVWHALVQGEAEDLVTLAQKAAAGSVMFRLAVRLAGLASNVMSGSPLVIAVRVTATVSVGSTTASLITGIVIVAVVLPAGIVTECVMAV